MIPVTVVDEGGREHHLFDYDPDYAPPLPRGATRGNIRAQEFCRMCHVPRYFYVDCERTCVQCGASFVFTGREQKYWYETLHFHFDSVATRCVACRRKRRSDQALRQQLVDAKAKVGSQPDDPAALLGVAEAIVRYFERHAEASLDEAIAASRKARRLLSGHANHDAIEALFWEAMCHALAGRVAQARCMFLELIEAKARGRARGGFLKEARIWIDAHPE